MDIMSVKFSKSDTDKGYMHDLLKKLPTRVLLRIVVRANSAGNAAPLFRELSIILKAAKTNTFAPCEMTDIYNLALILYCPFAQPGRALPSAYASSALSVNGIILEEQHRIVWACIDRELTPFEIEYYDIKR